VPSTATKALEVGEISEEVRSRFDALARTWREETAISSSLTAMFAHPAYRQIVELGPQIVPLLLQELERDPNYWFAALQELTGVDPVQPRDRGRLRAMADAWLRWGRANGYQW
jgi:hypothetical protein